LRGPRLRPQVEKNDSQDEPMNLRDATPDDHMFISILLETAFEGPLEAELVRRLRADGDLALELVAEEDGTGTIIGHICFARMGNPDGWWSLAPVSVVQGRQSQGIGSEIIRYGLDRARQAKAQAVVVVGAPGFYSRFGFSSKAAERLNSPYPISHTLLFPIAPGTSGRDATLVYPPAFEALAAPQG
jgi:putative acetyltransferase